MLLVAFAFASTSASAYSIDNCGVNRANVEYAVTLAQTIMIRPLLDVSLGVRLFGVISPLFIPHLESRDTLQEYLLLSCSLDVSRDSLGILLWQC